MIRVGVIGARGRMGQMVCRAVADQDDMALVAAVDRSHVGESIGKLIGHPKLDVSIVDELDALMDADTEVAVDFTHPDVVMEGIRWAIEHAMHIVVGTTGFTEERLDEVARMIELENSETNIIIAPNFAIGAVLMQRFAAVASHYLPAVEVIELHHDGKADAPSGTASTTAERIARERSDDYRGPSAESVPGVRGGEVEGIRVHSVRLPGLVAHQEVILGGLGQTLTIRHDSMDRSSFMPGVLLAVRAVSTRPGLTVGLEPLLEFPEIR